LNDKGYAHAKGELKKLEAQYANHLIRFDEYNEKRKDLLIVTNASEGAIRKQARQKAGEDFKDSVKEFFQNFRDQLSDFAAIFEEVGPEVGKVMESIPWGEVFQSVWHIITLAWDSFVARFLAGIWLGFTEGATPNKNESGISAFGRGIGAGLVKAWETAKEYWGVLVVPLLKAMWVLVKEESKEGITDILDFVSKKVHESIEAGFVEGLKDLGGLMIQALLAAILPPLAFVPGLGRKVVDAVSTMFTSSSDKAKEGVTGVKEAEQELGSSIERMQQLFTRQAKYGTPVNFVGPTMEDAGLEDDVKKRALIWDKAAEGPLKYADSVKVGEAAHHSINTAAKLDLDKTVDVYQTYVDSASLIFGQFFTWFQTTTDRVFDNLNTAVMKAQEKLDHLSQSVTQSGVMLLALQPAQTEEEKATAKFKATSTYEASANGMEQVFAAVNAPDWYNDYRERFSQQMQQIAHLLQLMAQQRPATGAVASGGNTGSAQAKTLAAPG
jgi:hypothetical protein